MPTAGWPAAMLALAWLMYMGCLWWRSGSGGMVVGECLVASEA